MPQCLSLFLRVCVLIPVVLSMVTRSDASPQEPSSGGRASTPQPATVAGVLTLQYVDDFARGRSELIHTVRDERTGKSFRLRFERGVPANLRSGMRVMVRGRAHGSEIHLNAEDGDSGVVVLALDSSSTSQQTAQVSGATTPVTGDQKTIVIVANFRDAVVNPLRPGADCSVQAIGDRVFTDPLGQSVDALYRDMSAGAVSFSGTVAGPYTLNAASTDSCASNSWAAAADALAIADGVDLTEYARKVYVLPSSTCPAAGLADLGVTPSRAWVFTCDVPHVYAHELGHNLGMHHAATATSEYGDDSDIMGMLGGLLPVNAPHKTQMGWVADSAVVEISQGGTFDVAPLALPAGQATAPQVLKVRRPDSSDYYYVSYRHGTGFEGNACCDYLDRLSVHRWSGGNDKTYLLAALADGQSYVDPDNGFTVTQLSHGATVAAARIQIGGSCGSTAPTLLMSPRDQTGAPGTTRGYDLTVVNNDAAGCDPANLAFQGSAPSAWTTTLSATSLQLAPGAVGHTTLSVTPPAAAPSGTVSVAVNVTDPNTPAHAASITGSYSVVPVCLNRPVATFAVSTQTAPAGTALTYSLSVRNTDAAGCAVTRFIATPAAPAGWTVTASASSLDLAPGGSATVTYSVAAPASALAGSYGLSVRVADGTNPVHEVTATGNFVVEAGDTSPPTIPASVAAAAKRGQVNVSWQPSTDNTGVAGYRIWRNGAIIATSTGTAWADRTVAAGATYTYLVAAYDAAGNISPASSGATIKLTGGAKGK